MIRVITYIFLTITVFSISSVTTVEKVYSITTAGEPLASDTTQSKLINVDYNKLNTIIERWQGKRAVLVNFWATWCGPCVEELPYLKKLQSKYPEKLKVILVSADLQKDRERVVPFLEVRGIDWITYYKSGIGPAFLNKISDSWSGALPYTKILDKKGNLVNQWEGAANYKKFKSNVKKALEDS